MSSFVEEEGSNASSYEPDRSTPAFKPLSSYIIGYPERTRDFKEFPCQNEATSFSPLNSYVITPFGFQLEAKFPWAGLNDYGCGTDWPHKGSALTLGESSILKYGVSYPLRIGLDQTEEDGEGRREVIFIHEGNNKSDNPSLLGDRIYTAPVFEEIYLNHGICTASIGPLGGPSKLKGVFRPLDSYGTGSSKVNAVVKVDFLQDATSTIKDTYYCMVENNGVSLYADGRSESHVAYMAEFQIERVLPCMHGLLVVPLHQPYVEVDIDKAEAENQEWRYLYILTHPTKQVSKIWLKDAGNDFTEFDTAKEKLVWCERSVCVFWNCETNAGFSLKKILPLKKQDILDSTALNSSLYYTSGAEQMGSPFSPAGGSLMYSPIGRHPVKTSSTSLRIGSRDASHKDGSPSRSIFPNLSIDVSNSSSLWQGLSTGFFPPHYCVFDEPEMYLRPLFQFNVVSRDNEGVDDTLRAEPKKFHVVSKVDHAGNDEMVSVWFLMDTVLHMHSTDVFRGNELNSYEIHPVIDFTCSEMKYGTFMLAILTDNNTIKVGVLDDAATLNKSMIVTHSIDQSITSLINFVHGETLICGLSKSGDKGVISFRNLESCGIVSICIEKFSKCPEIPSWIVCELVARYTLVSSTKATSSVDEEWTSFVETVKEVIAFFTRKNNDIPLYFEDALHELVEDCTESKCDTSFTEKIAQLYDWLRCIRGLLGERVPSYPNDLPHSAYHKFISYLGKERSLMLDYLPDILSNLLQTPDSLETLSRLSSHKNSGGGVSPLVDVLLADTFNRNKKFVKFSHPDCVKIGLGRLDYLVSSTCEQSGLSHNVKYNPLNDRDNLNDESSNWTSYVLNLQIFAEDRRVEEVCRLLDSTSPIMIDIEQKAEMSDHDYLEDQEKYLLQVMQITLSAPVGRCAFTLRTEVKSFSNLTNCLYVPKLCFTGKCSRRGTNIELSDTDLTASLWPSFHNSVAAATAVRFTGTPAEAWFSYNKAKTGDGAEQAGILLGFGLNEVLTSMPATLQHEYLSKEDPFLSMAMLLGLAANKLGTGDIATWKVISLHIGAMLPAHATELEIPKLASLAAPCALGLLFLGTHHSHVAKVLLGEISKRYSPLSLFGGGVGSNTAAAAFTGDTNGSIADREAHSLCAGLGLGFVNLGKGRSGERHNTEDVFDGILRRFVVGGPKPSSGCADDEDMCQMGPTMPSLWEEYRCCHIEEGDNVNVDVATPSAIVAVALTYLRSGNEIVMKWLAPPTTKYLLDGVRPDILMLRSLAYILVLDKIPNVSVDWLEKSLMPPILADNDISKDDFKQDDQESNNQSWASIICGYCMGLGIRHAGTRDQSTVDTIHHYINYMLKLSSSETSINGSFPKNFLESTLCSMLLALSLLLAGSGEVSTLRLLRYMQNKISTLPVTASSNTYGLEMCISMAIGILFLGGGRYSLSCDDRSIAVILASVFPKWPINANDNRYHLQSLRHLFILASQPRLLLPQAIAHGSSVYFDVVYVNGTQERLKAPLLLPPLEYISSVTLVGKEYLPVQFVLPRDLPYLKKVVANNGVLTLVKKPVTSIKHNFLQHMKWREAKILHSTFPYTSQASLTMEENHELMELNLAGRIMEGAGLKEILPALLSLQINRPESEEWKLELRVLYNWVLRAEKSWMNSTIPIELLALLLNKTEVDYGDIIL